MVDKIKKLLIKYKEIIMYGIFGVLTTVVSYVVFILFTELIVISKNTLFANILSNAAGIAFAYFTNRKYVFESKAKSAPDIVKEATKFVSGRLLTFVLDLAFVFIAVDVLKGSGPIWKLVSNVVVIILNYVISKFLVFTKKIKVEEKEKEEEQVVDEIPEVVFDEREQSLEVEVIEEEDIEIN
ncbi:MAG: GtrA family protein [Clostridia bacterium]|nr:GtrA family protein [Clostridia bacterium]